MDEKPKGRFETTKLFEENTGERICNLGLGKSFLEQTPVIHKGKGLN